MSNLANPRPVKLSTMEELCDMRKSSVDKVLDDDYYARDRFDSSVKVKGNSAKGETFLKTNHSIATKTADGSLQFKYSDNIEFRSPMFGMNVKGKVKGDRMFEHWDMGIKEWNVNFKGTDKSIWFNPYVRWSSSTSLTNIALNLGYAAYWCKNYKERTQLNYNPLNAVEGKSAWSICSRKQFTMGNFWADGCGGVNLGALKDMSLKKLRMGWRRSKLGLTAQLNNVSLFNGGCPIKDSIWLGASWNCSRIGTMVARVKYFMDARPVGCEVGLQKVVNDKVTVKGKVDCDWNLNLMGKFQCVDGLSFETSVMANMADPQKVDGLFDLPLKLGLKAKFNR